MENRTKVIVVQHPREEYHPLNTTRIAEHSLQNVQVVRAALVSRMAESFARASISPDAAILYPSADAENLEEIPPEKFPQEIIVIDGTWHHAKALLRDIPALHSYRRIRFTPSSPSEYRIRKEPKADYLSTIESIAYVLNILEPNTQGIESLRATFRRMIDRNVAARIPAEKDTRFRQRKDRRHLFSTILHQDTSRLVLVYAEGTRRTKTIVGEGAQPQFQGMPKEPLVVHALRFDQSVSLQLLLKTKVRPPERLLQNLALAPEDLDARGVSRDEACGTLKDFLRPHDIVVAWNASTLSILKQLVPGGFESLLLKGAYCDWQNFQAQRKAYVSGSSLEEHQGWGGLDGILERHKITRSRPLELGRAPLRLTQSHALLGWMLEEARENCESLVGG